MLASSFFFGVSAVPSFAQYSSLYGSGVNSDALNNVTIGPNGHQVSYRFVANHTGTVSKVHFYLIVNASKAGYNAGNGGCYESSWKQMTGRRTMARREVYSARIRSTIPLNLFR